MVRFKVLALALVLMLAITPLAALAQDDQKYEEFESEDGLFMLSVPEDWAVQLDETAPFPVLVMINSEEGMERILVDDDPISGDQGILVYVFPGDFFSFLGISVTEDMTPLETVDAIAELFFEPPVDDEGNVIEEEIVELGESQEVEVSEERTAGAVMVDDATTEGLFMTFRPGEGLVALLLAVAYPGEFTDELNAMAETVAASVEYTGSSDELMMSILGGAAGDESSSDTESDMETDSDSESSGDTSALDGMALIEARCSTCHTTDRIYNADKDEAGWTATVDRMIGYGAALDDAERDAVISYLVENQ